MEEIKCTSYEKREFIRFLKYAKEMKMKTKIKQGKFDDTYYDVQQIELLIQRVEGKVPYQSYHKDSLSWTHEGKEEQENKINWQYYNNNRSKNAKKK